MRQPKGSRGASLLAHLHDRDDLNLDTVTKWLNARGKGNSVAWLKETKDYRDATPALKIRDH
jgi:hypothetical protein